VSICPFTCFNSRNTALISSVIGSEGRLKNTKRVWTEWVKIVPGMCWLGLMYWVRKISILKKKKEGVLDVSEEAGIEINA
jgi:hypothetical protein